MSTPSRADILKRLYTELKKKYTPVVPAERSVLEHFIYATCLEDATYEAADAAFNALVTTMSGWNEVRVSSVAELAELMPQLPDPRVTGDRIRKILHAVFEERYSFDIDDIRKKNLKEAYEKLEKIPGGTPFSINYTAQVALGRHGIPVGNGEKRLLYVLGIIKLEDIDEREVTGLNRAITKSQGLEFASLLHQLTAAFVVNPESQKILSFVRKFAPDFRDRMPRRREPRIENSMETPKPVEIKEKPSKRNIMQLLMNDPDFRKEREKDKRMDRDEYEFEDSQKAKAAYIEEMGKKEPLFDEAAARKQAARNKKKAEKERKAAELEKKQTEKEKTAPKEKKVTEKEKPTPAVKKAPEKEKPAPAVKKAPEKEKPAPAVKKAPEKEKSAPAKKAPEKAKPAPVEKKAPEKAKPAPVEKKAPEKTKPAPAVKKAPEKTKPAPVVKKAPEKAKPAPVVKKAPEKAKPTPVAKKAPEKAKPAPAVKKAPEKAKPAPKEKKPAEKPAAKNDKKAVKKTEKKKK